MSLCVHLSREKEKIGVSGFLQGVKYSLICGHITKTKIIGY
jgi:hypothetical protein